MQSLLGRLAPIQDDAPPRRHRSGRSPDDGAHRNDEAHTLCANPGPFIGSVSACGGLWDLVEANWGLGTESGRWEDHRGCGSSRILI